MTDHRKYPEIKIYLNSGKEKSKNIRWIGLEIGKSVRICLGLGKMEIVCFDAKGANVEYLSSFLLTEIVEGALVYD